MYLWLSWELEKYQPLVESHFFHLYASGIVNDANDRAEERGNPRYILDLLLSVITVSMKTMEIVEILPRFEY